MTISKGTGWGQLVDRPEGLRVATSDSELAAMLSDAAARAGAALERIGIGHIGLDTPVGALPIGQRQLVEIARLLAERHVHRRIVGQSFEIVECFALQVAHGGRIGCGIGPLD